MKDPTLQALSALFLAFPSQERTDNEKELGRVYLMAVEDVPADFIALACKRFIQGLVQRPNLTWRPTPAELAVEARQLRDKALNHERIAALPARQRFLPNPEPIDCTAITPEMWQELKDSIRHAADSMAPPRKSRWAVAPPDYTPKVDVSDFPDAKASSAELQEWEARQKASIA